MSDSSMQGLQNRAGDLGSRLSGISSGLRGLNFSGNALGPIGLFAVPALNASNDNAVSQADRGAKAFTEVQSGLKATHQTAVNTDANQSSNLKSIDTTTDARNVRGAGNSTSGNFTPGGPTASGPPAIKGGADSQTSGAKGPGGGPVAVGPNLKGGSNTTSGVTTTGGSAVGAAPNIKGDRNNTTSGVNTTGGSPVGTAPNVKGGGNNATSGVTTPGGPSVGATPTTKGGSANTTSSVNTTGGSAVGTAPNVKGDRNNATSGVTTPGGPSVGTTPTTKGGSANTTSSVKGAGTPAAGAIPTIKDGTGATQGVGKSPTSFTPTAPGYTGGGKDGAAQGSIGAAAPGGKGTTSGGGAKGPASSTPTAPGYNGPGNAGSNAGTKPSVTAPGPQNAVASPQRGGTTPPPNAPGTPPPTTPGPQNAVTATAQGVSRSGGVSPGVTPPSAAPGMAPPIAGGAPGAGGERGNSKFGAPGTNKGVFDAPKPPAPDTITKAPAASKPTPPQPAGTVPQSPQTKPAHWNAPNSAPAPNPSVPAHPTPAPVGTTAVPPPAQARPAPGVLPRAHPAAQPFQAQSAHGGGRKRATIKKFFTVDIPGAFKKPAPAPVPTPAVTARSASADPWVDLLRKQAAPSTVDVDVLKTRVAQAVLEGKPGKARVLINRLQGSDKQAEVQRHYDDAVAVRGDEGAVEVPKELHFAWFGTTPNEAAVRSLLEWGAKVQENNERSTSPEQNWKATLWTDSSSAGWAPEVGQQLADAGIEIQADVESLVNDLSTDVQNRTDTKTTINDVYSAAKDPSAKAYNLQADIARYAVLAKHGGVYVDVDIRPGAVSLDGVGDLKMQPTDLPLFAPRLRDQHSVDNALAGQENVAPGAELGTAAEIQYGKGELNNNFIVAPPGNDFLHDLTDIIPKKFESLQSYGMSQAEFSKALKVQAPDISGPNVLVDGGLTPSTGLIGQFTMKPENHGLRIDLDYLPQPMPLVEKTDYSALFDPGIKNSWTGLEWVTPESETQLDAGSIDDNGRESPRPAADTTAAAVTDANTTTGGPGTGHDPTPPRPVPAEPAMPAASSPAVPAEIGTPDTGTAQERRDGKTRRELTEQIAAMGLDPQRAVSTFDDLTTLGSVENHVADVLSSPGVQGAVSRISAAAGSLAPEQGERVRALLTDLLVTTSAVPVRHRVVGDITRLNIGHVHDWRTARPMTPAKLEQVLAGIASDVEAGRVPLSDLPHHATDPLPRRLAVLGTLNLSPRARADLLTHPPFTALLDSPHLADALFAGKGLDEQRFLNTCEPSVVHTGLRDTLPTLGGQVYAGRALADNVEQALQRALESSPELMAQKESPGGRTVEQLVRDRLAEARDTFDRLEEQSSTGSPDWAALSDDWGRAMQKLAAVSDPSEGVDSIPVLSRKVIGGAWAASAVLSLPMGFDRPGRRATGVSEDYRLIAEQVLADPTPQGSTRPLADMVDDKFWSRLHHVGVLPVSLEGRFTAHALSVQAVRHEGAEAYLVGDPKKKHFDLLEPDAFAAWAAGNNAEAALPSQITVNTGPSTITSTAGTSSSTPPANAPTVTTPPADESAPNAHAARSTGLSAGTTAGVSREPSVVAGSNPAPTNPSTPATRAEAATAVAEPSPAQGRPAGVLDWARRMPLVDLAMTDPAARIRQGQSTREHVQRVLDVLGRPAPRSLPGLGQFLPKIIGVTARGPEASTRNDAVALASVVDNVARDMAESFNDPLLKPLFAQKIIESQADRLRWDGDASSPSMSQESVRLAGALVSDDPLTSLMRGDVELPAVAARVENIAQRAGLDPRTTFDLLRRRYEAEMLSYTMSEIQQGKLGRDANANGSFDLENLPGEIPPGYHRGTVELRDTTSQRFFDNFKRGKPGAPEWNNKDLVLTKAASDRLDALRAVLAPAPVAETAVVFPAAAAPPTATTTASTPLAAEHPPPLPFTAADLVAGRNALTASTATTSVPLPGSDRAGSLTQRQYEHLRDIRTNRLDGDQAGAAARRASVRQNLVEKLGVPDVAAAEQVLAKTETWFSTAPITISLKAGAVFGTDEGTAALVQPDASYLPAAEIGLHVVDSSTLETLRTRKSDVDVRRAEVDRLVAELGQKAKTEDAFRPSPGFKALQSEHQRAKAMLTAAEIDAARTPRQARYLEGLLAEDPDFAFWTQSNDVNSARGDNYTRWRREKDDIESGRRGFGPHEAAVFGAVNVNYDRTKGFEGTDYYGETHLLLDPDVRRRSYYTFGSKGPERSDIVDLMHDMFEQGRTNYVSGIVQNALGLDGMVPQQTLLLETHVYGGVQFGRDVAEVSAPQTGLDPAVRARIEAFATSHGITVVEPDPATWPERRTEVDAAALTSALASPATPPGPEIQPSPPRLPELDLGKPFVEELFDEIDARTSTAPRPVDLRDAVRWRSPDDTGPLTPDRLEQEFGVPKTNQERFQNFVDRFNIVLDVRPTNPESVRWLYDGAMPKPKDIKAKTINQTDVLLGADPSRTGLVGFFQPSPPPDLPGTDPALQEKAARRFEERTAEFAELIGTMQEYERDGKFKVVDGVVYGANSRGDFIWVTGDADMYGMYDPDGNRLGADDYESMVFLLTNRNVGVQHGAHLYWDPVTDFDRKIFDTIVAKHVSDEPLVRFNPGQPPALVLADPLPARAGASSETTPAEAPVTPRQPADPPQIGIGGPDEHDTAESAPPSLLTPHEEHVSNTRRHLRHLSFDVLNGPTPPPVTWDGLYAAVGQVLRQDPVALRAQVLNNAATTAVVSQAAADFTATRPVPVEHLRGALVESTTWRMHADAGENDAAGHARDLAGHLIASRLGTSLVIHQGAGTTPLVLTPVGTPGGTSVEIDMVVVNGRVTYRPH